MDVCSYCNVYYFVCKLYVNGAVCSQDQELSAATDGSYLGERYFRCPANKGLFVKLRNCRRDSRFPEPELPINQVDRCNSIGEHSFTYMLLRTMH